MKIKSKRDKKLIKSQQRFKKQNIFSEEVKKTALSASNDKRIQTISAIQTYAYGTCKDLKKKKLNVTM